MQDWLARAWGAVWLAGVLMLAGAAAGASSGGGDQPATSGQEQPSGQSARRALSPRLRMVLDKLDAASGKVTDVTARIVYKREIPLLEESQKSRGALVFKKPNKLALKLGKPRNEEVVSNGKLWWLVNHNDRQVEIYKAAEPGQGSQETAFLDFSYGKSSDELLKEYTVELLSEAKDKAGVTTYRLKFTPKRRPDRPARYAAIEVEVSDKDWLPQVLVLHESGGEIIHTYTLSHVRLNTGVKDKAFEYKPPSGYTVLRPDES